MDFVAIDFETADRKTQAICSCALVLVRNGEIKDTKEWLIKPSVETSFDNSNLHGITYETVMNKPTFDLVWPEIRSYIEGQLVLAHNAKSADINFLIKALENNTNSNEIPEFEFFCSMELAKKLLPGEKYGLKHLAQRFEIDFEHHDALSDATATVCLVLAMSKEHKIKDQRLFLDQHDLVYSFSMDRNYKNQKYQSNYRPVGVSLSIGSLGNSVFNETLILDHCKDEAEFDRGKQLFEKGKVEILEIDSEYCKGQIAGSRATPYQMEIDNTLGKSACDCKAWINSTSPKFCKHCAALALAWLAKGGPPQKKSVLNDELLDRLLIPNDSQTDEGILEMIHAFDESEAMEFIDILLESCPEQLIEVVRSLRF